MDRNLVNCAHCIYYDDIMLMNECEDCALKLSKPNQVINFKPKV